MNSDLTSIETLGNTATVDAADTLKHIETSTNDKELRKAARKALYNLSQRGIYPDAAKIAPKDSLPKGSDIRAFASSFDGAGNRLLIFLIPSGFGGSISLIEVLMNDLEGTKHLNTMKIARRELEPTLARFQGGLDGGLAIAEIDVDYARQLLAESRAILAADSKRSPRGVMEWLPKIGLPTKHYDSPIYSLITKEKLAADDSFSKEPGDLFSLPWFEPWFFAVEDTMPWLEEWENLTGDPDTVQTDDSKARIEEIIIDAANNLMLDNMQQIYTRRLEEAADILWRSGQEIPAKQSLYHAIEMQKPGKPSEIAFARDIAHRTLGAALEMVKIHRERRASEH